MRGLIASPAAVEQVGFKDGLNAVHAAVIRIYLPNAAGAGLIRSKWVPMRTQPHYRAG